ncbi:MAG: hypothetical protein L6V93_04475 [Clostridiales bacterium]|nr:MAG: hypothetical protein L6V93_04475 [Clostridiales bacterium]
MGKKIKHPSEVVSEGETVEVYVIDFNKETGKSFARLQKKLCDNPWEKSKSRAGSRQRHRLQKS